MEDADERILNAEISKIALIVVAQLTSVLISMVFTGWRIQDLFTFTWIMNSVSDSIKGTICSLNISINLN